MDERVAFLFLAQFRDINSDRGEAEFEGREAGVRI
jgi:hypothetical protein